MTKHPPRWQAHATKDYDAAMSARCGQLLTEIVADPHRRQAILADPLDLHRELFAPFAPSDHPEYAGTYRGTPGTALFDRGFLPRANSSRATTMNSACPAKWCRAWPSC